MFLRILSDIHLESKMMEIQPEIDDCYTTLVLAGDIMPIKCHPRWSHIRDRLREFMTTVTKQFKEVIVVLGNHDYYHNEFHAAKKAWKDLANELGFTVLDRETLIRDDVAIIGATLWTDYNGADPFLMLNAKNYMYDYTVINVDGKGMTSQFIYDHHMADKNFIFSEIYKHKDEGRKVVVVTHHAPSWKSVTARFVGDGGNGYFVNQLDEDILDAKPDVWIHGHVHSQHDYAIGDCRVLCNSRGYAGHYEEVGEFKERLIIEV